MQNRRTFIKLSALTLINVSVLGKTLKPLSDMLAADDDEKICKQKFLLLLNNGVKDLPIGELIAEVGKSFEGTSYVAGTLEKNPNLEKLVINLTGLDCVTFVENCLVFARSLKQNNTSFENYITELTKIRYRNGEVDEYPSRLHYFTDWIYDNEKKGIVKNITKEIGGINYDKSINFMSTHPASYKQLSDESYLRKIIETENDINSREHFYIPKNKIRESFSYLKTGDIIGTTTSIPGLDITHTGFVYKINNDDVYFMHASSKAKKVVVSDNNLADYVNEDSKKTGIIVARPLEP